MITAEEIAAVHELIDRVRDVRDAVGAWAEYCADRKLKSHDDRSWDDRVAKVNDAVAAMRTAERLITESFS